MTTVRVVTVWRLSLLLCHHHCHHPCHQPVAIIDDSSSSMSAPSFSRWYHSPADCYRSSSGYGATRVWPLSFVRLTRMVRLVRLYILRSFEQRNGEFCFHGLHAYATKSQTHLSRSNDMAPTREHGSDAVLLRLDNSFLPSHHQSRGCDGVRSNSTRPASSLPSPLIHTFFIFPRHFRTFSFFVSFFSALLLLRFASFSLLLRFSPFLFLSDPLVQHTMNESCLQQCHPPIAFHSSRHLISWPHPLHAPIIHIHHSNSLTHNEAIRYDTIRQRSHRIIAMQYTALHCVAYHIAVVSSVPRHQPTGIGCMEIWCAWTRWDGQ